jgi:hypothetical protein
MFKHVDKKELIKDSLDKLEDSIWQLLGISSTDPRWFEALPRLMEIRNELVEIRRQLVIISHKEPHLSLAEPLIHNAGSSPDQIKHDKHLKQEPAFRSLQDTLPQGQ